MSTDAGAGGAFGILLSNHQDQLAIDKLYNEWCCYVDNTLNGPEKGEDDGVIDGEPETVPLLSEYRDKFIRAFADLGIVVPPEAALLWTGSSDDRPARCKTPAEEWVLGFGFFTFPWNYPPMDQTFRDASEFWDWVWMG